MHRVGAAALLLLVAGSCAPPPPTAPAPGAPVPTAAPVPSPAPAPAGPTPSAPAAGPAFDESLLRGRDYLLEAAPALPALARDRLLGPLAPRSHRDLLVEAFLRQAAAGSLGPETTDPAWAEYLASWARRTKLEAGSGWTVRLGPERPDPAGGALVPARWSQGQRGWSGWVLLVPGPDGERVSDAALQPFAAPDPPYDPELPQASSTPRRR